VIRKLLVVNFSSANWSTFRLPLLFYIGPGGQLFVSQLVNFSFAKYIGRHNGEERIIKTSDTKKSFLDDKEPVAHELAGKVAKQFEIITQERDMGH
jgi:hypothetical protein